MKLRHALSVLAVALACAPAASQAAVPGVNLAGIPSAAQLDAAAASGAKTVRVFVLWSDLEPSKGHLAGGWEAYADIARGTVARGMKPVFVVTTTPAWANGGAGANVPPSNPQDMADFFTLFASKDGLKGNVAGYEIWNEQDEEHFWTQPAGASRVETYARLVNAVGPAIHAADPAAKVVLGPTTGNNYGFIEGLYGAGINRAAFDVIAVHTDTACLDRGPYEYYRDPAANNRIARYTFLGYREVRAVALAHGDDKPIWMTELGWTTTTSTCERGMWAGKKPAGVTVEAQALHLKQAFHCLAQDPYVQHAQWFTMYDNPGTPVEELRHYGLLGVNGSPKPSYNAFREVAHAPGHDVMGGDCGDFNAPSIRIIKPEPGTQFVDKLDVQAAAVDGGAGLGRISFGYNGGQEIRNFTDALSNDKAVGLAPWFGSSKLPLGKHVIEVRAVDMAGNVGTATVEVEKVKTLRATLTPTFKLGKKVRCKRRSCSFGGKLLRGKPGSPSITGKVRVAWEVRNKQGRWRKLVGGLKPANKPFTFRAKLKKGGRWRVKVTYLGVAPWKKTTARPVAFRVR